MSVWESDLDDVSDISGIVCEIDGVQEGPEVVVHSDPSPHNSPPASVPGPVVWLYLSQANQNPQNPQQTDAGPPRDLRTEVPDEVSSRLVARVHSLVKNGALRGRADVHPTACGVILALSDAQDAEYLLASDLSSTLGEAVQASKFVRPKQTVLLRGVPPVIPIPDVLAALRKQGLTMCGAERIKSLVRVELRDPSDFEYHTLLTEGVDFFGAIRFPVVPDRGARPVGWTTAASSTASSPGEPSAAGDASNASAAGEAGRGRGELDVLQCYRCQGFWHVAGNCRHLPRCVRCGEPHTVEFCPRPRNDPVCCHCAGPHHAAFRQCPVRRQLVNAVPLTITMTSRTRSDGSPHDQPF